MSQFEAYMSSPLKFPLLSAAQFFHRIQIILIFSVLMIILNRFAFYLALKQKDFTITLWLYCIGLKDSLKDTRMYRQRVIILSSFAVSATFLLCGCSKPTRLPTIFGEGKNSVSFQTRFIGASFENRPIECIILGAGNDVSFILATIHGDEPAGTTLVMELSQYLQQKPELLIGRKVVLMPVANPDGLVRNQRHNARGVDLNRNFSVANRLYNAVYGYSALSEPEARIIEHVIREYKPARIVSIHQPFGCIDYDGPAKILAEQMAQLTRLPMKKLGAMPGSLGSSAGVELGIPIVTLELLPDDHKLDAQTLWRRYGAGLIAAIIYPETDALPGK